VTKLVAQMIIKFVEGSLPRTQGSVT